MVGFDGEHGEVGMVALGMTAIAVLWAGAAAQAPDPGAAATPADAATLPTPAPSAGVPAGDSADLAAVAAPGFERVLLAGNRLLRARVRSREGGNALLEREDGLLVLARERSIERVLSADEVFPAAGGGALVYLRDGRVVRGRPVLRGWDGLLLEDDGGARVFVRDVRLVQGADAPLAVSRPPLVPAPSAAAPARVRTRPAGRVLEGSLLGRSEDALLVEAQGLGRVAVLADAVEHLDVAPGAKLPPRTRAEPWPPDPTAHRGLALPTALLRDGGAVVSQTGLVTSVDAWPLRHLQLSVGTVWPIWYHAEVGNNVLATAKGGFGVGERLHLAGGVQGVLAEAGSSVFAFAAATYGTPELSASVYAGPPLPGSLEAGRFGDRVFAASAAWRVSPRFAALTEHWVGLDGEAAYAGALGVRHVRRRFAIDLAVMLVPDSDVPLAWVAFGYAVAMPREVAP
jgi:hypothetical protein